MDQGMIAYFDAHFSRVDERFTALDQRLDRVESRLDAVEGRLASVEEAVRHTHIVVEGMRGDLRLVAEGVIGSNERQDRIQSEILIRLKDVEALIRPSYPVLDLRLKVLESWKERTDRDPVEIVKERFGRPNPAEP